ncbi:glycoside hydrolase family 18 protein [Aquiflexum gelatinilyticum]|uniref:glycoside hydrolase family 18 protein n=1 Tax=Aquiflexum gelatinilyticum TaxID=2961943 RepID=UPI00216A5EF9|nr:glycoside hydrolase family 18 protein [Aquiflexum gelatinilyticum]MCS4433544.1 glycoside hydrolase family 18 protein [Aquiflexum gelatinilyticum]
MINIKRSFLFLLLIGLFSCESNNTTVSLVAGEEHKYKIIGYIAGWKGVDTAKIDAAKMTHINYAFANVIDGKVMEGEGREKSDKENLTKLNSLKSLNPDLKILISIGGWTWSKGFSDAALTEESRKIFTASAIDYLVRHDLDGLDFDWEYPGLPGDNNPYRQEDKENFVLMLKSVREALDSLGSINDTHYLSTIASAGFKEYLDVNDLGQAQKYLDFINIMTYDYIVQFSSDTTGHHANLYTMKPNERSTEKAVKDHIAAGVPAEKLVMGMAFYGRSWENVAPENNGLYQFGKGSKGYPFSAISELMKDSLFVRHWDENAKAPFLWNEKERVFVTFEDAESISEKTKFIKKHKMGGAMFWEYSEDTEDHTLLNAIYENLK